MWRCVTWCDNVCWHVTCIDMWRDTMWCVMQHDVVWRDMTMCVDTWHVLTCVWRDVMWCGAMWCVVQHDVVWCDVIARAQCLLAYNYVVSKKITTRRAAMMKGLPGGLRARYVDKLESCGSQTLLFGGRRDGCLCVYNWDSGSTDYTIKVLGLFTNIFILSHTCTVY